MKFSKKINYFYKIGFYFLSLDILFGIFFVLNCFDKDMNIKSLDSIFNLYGIILIIFMLIGLFTFYLFKKMLVKRNLSVELKKVESINFEYMSFFYTYIMPLIFVNFGDKRNYLITFILLFFIGVIYIRTNLYYSNPILAIYGFKIYRVEYESKNKVQKKILISKDDLHVDDHIVYQLLSDDIIYGGKNR
ncbi:hypothetical protein C7380_12018 [Oceanotoga teriensis]|uniref:Uncharacterized protein n=1 Tax=Oceanotoga teriensis TaxID=515440 RepID=A0AA45HHY2_9BACT|nr:anti-phage protein KwaA [Oceanotoga teriensis]PWJ88080.1 hypothetical protein C7380_12018 [Oceanotoga teriensis]